MGRRLGAAGPETVRAWCKVDPLGPSPEGHLKVGWWSLELEACRESVPPVCLTRGATRARVGENRGEEGPKAGEAREAPLPQLFPQIPPHPAPHPAAPEAVGSLL